MSETNHEAASERYRYRAEQAESQLKELQAQVKERDGVIARLFRPLGVSKLSQALAKYRQLEEAASEAETYKATVDRFRELIGAGEDDDPVEMAESLVEAASTIQGEYRAMKHSATFARLAKENGVQDHALEDFYARSGYEPGDDEPDEAAIVKLITELKPTKTWAFIPGEGTGAGEGIAAGTGKGQGKAEVAAKASPVVPPESSRGTSAGGPVPVTREMINDRDWNAANRDLLADVTRWRDLGASVN